MKRNRILQQKITLAGNSDLNDFLLLAEIENHKVKRCYHVNINERIIFHDESRPYRYHLILN
jgi:hypothetical protein